ncbi:MAG TPA: MFS transporter [Bauldia sp.]|nr:MFS transporter [Bauldia sp.]
MTAPTVTPAKATRREWIGLAVLILPCLIYSMDLTVLNLAVPHLSEALQPGAVQLLWIIDIYGFLVAGCLATMGTLGDRIGRRKLLLIGAAAFAGGSMLAAFAPNADLLVGARALLGIAGATIAPSTLSLIRNMFHDDGERTFAIGVWGTSYAVGGSIGPVLGGILLEYFWWGSVFLLAVPAMALVLILGPRLIPEYKSPGAERLDLASAALSLTAVLGVVYGLKQIAQDGLHVLPAAAILAGIAVGVVFVRRQRRLPDPFIDLALFRKPAFSAALATNVFGVFVIFGSFLFSSQYLQLMLGLSPLEAALWMLPASVTTVIGSMSAPLVVRFVPPAMVVAGGLGLCSLGFLILTQVDGSLPLLIAGMLIASIGLGPVFILTTDLIVGSAPPERAGSAAAISETGAEFGGVFGIAVLGSIGMAVYRGMIAERIPPDVPASAAKAARDTLGGATAAAGDLPGATGDALLMAARDAFATGYVTVAAISALLTLALAVTAAFFFRKAPAPARA